MRVLTEAGLAHQSSFGTNHPEVAAQGPSVSYPPDCQLWERPANQRILKWAKLGSNQRPLPCEGSAMVCWRFLELTESLQMAVCPRWHFPQHFRRFTRVAARLLHRFYGLHPHKVRDDCYSTSRLEATSASFVLGVFRELRRDGVLGSCSSPCMPSY
jgi:hypothetical protein